MSETRARERERAGQGRLGKKPGKEIGQDDGSKEAANEEGQIDPEGGEEGVEALSDHEAHIEPEKGAEEAEVVNVLVGGFVRDANIGLGDFGGGELVFLDEVAGDGAADERGENKADGGTGDADLEGIGNAVFGDENGGPGDGGAMPADEGNRAAEETNDFIQADEMGHGDADGVLQKHVNHGGGEENKEGFAAASQGGKIGIESDGGEEVEQEEIAGGEVEGEGGAAQSLVKSEEDTNDESTGDRFRDIEITKEAQSLRENFAQSEDKNRQIEGGKAIEGHGG
jgi:hypothetical protein